MTSKAYSQRGYLAPPAEDSHDTPLKYGGKVKRRRATVYDAVAGRVTTRGSSIRAHINTSLKPLSAQQVRFQRIGAPPIYAEKPDEYNFAAKVPPGSIPDSDLLKALHTYASDFYARTPDPRNARHNKKRDHEESFEAMQARLKSCPDFRSMDETALLTFGVLMEEMMRESLGDTGDLAFTEEGFARRRVVKRPKSKRSSKAASIVMVPDEEEEAQADAESQVEGDAQEAEAAQARKDKKKRRKARKSEGRKSKRGNT